MSVNGVCQTCGTIAPIEWFLADGDHRRYALIVAELPREVAPLVHHYLGLFKTDAGRAMQIRKAVRLATELKALVAAGHVQVDRRVARPCPPRLWALAIEQMIERRDRLSLPMPNHNYLKSIAWDLADKADAQREYSGQQQVPTRANGGPVQVSSMLRQLAPSALSPLDQYIQGQRDTMPTDEEMAAWKQARMNE